jgi:hypothetical protein
MYYKYNNTHFYFSLEIGIISPRFEDEFKGILFMKDALGVVGLSSHLIWKKGV